ncbi:hypothetical protein CERSUDRAFT_110007 [Gelatoporia subvermispora B]|uniref:Uncharacterized protein n=1 Tax=Ceriporiopsis subvermispora (strain B) TaxID=914234 RepID=M2RAJ7_CERS8|nr:hypothetical protein CERSUDRAFT_110007 [Gelatoporia subvermispora B]
MGHRHPWRWRRGNRIDDDDVDVIKETRLQHATEEAGAPSEDETGLGQPPMVESQGKVSKHTTLFSSRCSLDRAAAASQRFTAGLVATLPDILCDRLRDHPSEAAPLRDFCCPALCTALQTARHARGGAHDVGYSANSWQHRPAALGDKLWIWACLALCATHRLRRSTVLYVPGSCAPNAPDIDPWRAHS